MTTRASRAGKTALVAEKGKRARGAGARILKLLQRVAEGDGDFSLKTLAARLDLPPSTVHRLLQLLVRTDMIERTGAQAYRPGRELFRVAALITQKFDVQKIAQPFVRELWTEWQETCTFCLYRPVERMAMVVETIRSPHPLQLVIEPLTNLPLAWGSLGRSILAHLPDADVEAVLAEAARGPISGRPPPSRTQLRQELRRIRRRGYAVYEDEAVLNVAGVAAPVFAPGGKVLGSIGVTMPASRFEPSDRAELCAAVVGRAQRLSAAVGFDAKSPGNSSPAA